jgi:hypothetical protein
MAKLKTPHPGCFKPGNRAAANRKRPWDKIGNELAINRYTMGTHYATGYNGSHINRRIKKTDGALSAADWWHQWHEADTWTI